MKRKFTLVLSMLAVCGIAFAQQNHGFVQKSTNGTPVGGKTITMKSKTNNYEFSVGPRLGAGLAMMSEKDNLGVADGTGFCFDAGLAANVRFGSKDKGGRNLYGQGMFGIGLELNYAMRSLPTNSSDNLSLSYFEVPVLFQFYPVSGNKQFRNLYIELGPTFSALLSASPENLKCGYTIYNTGKLKGGDVKGTIGLGYRFNRASANDGFYLNLRYNLGTSDLAGNFPAKISTCELTIGYLFKCAGGKNKKQATPAQPKTTPKPNKPNKYILK